MIRALTWLLLTAHAASAVTTSAAAASNTNAKDEINRIPLVNTSQYDPQKNSRRSWKNSWTKASTWVFGDIAMKYFMDLSKDLSTELDGPDLRQYFQSEAEKKVLVDRVTAHLNAHVFSIEGVTNASAREAVMFIGNQLIGSIAGKVWRSEGVTDEARIEIWKRRILVPMNRCFAATDTYTEAQACIDAMKGDLISNIGMVLTYELTRQEIAPRASHPALAAQLPEAARTTFWSCKVQRKGAVDACVLSGVRSAIRTVADDVLTRIMRESKFPEKLQAKIKSSSLPSFDKCLADARNKEQILGCSDKLTQTAGAEISYHTVQIRLATTEKKRREELSLYARDEFHDCFQKKKSTDACSAVVTSRVIRRAAEREFESTVHEKLGSSAGKPSLEAARSELNRCWDDGATPSKREACLRRGVKTLTTVLAREILSKEATDSAKKDHPGFIDRLTESFPACLEKHLPANISEAKNLERNLQACTGPLTREAALLIAQSEMKAALSGHLPAVEVDRVIERRVDGRFAACLGESPVSAQLAECTFQLKTDVARLAPRRIFQREIEKVARGHTDASVFESQPVRDGLEKIYALHATCINTNADPNDAKKTDKAIDTCLRSSVERFALLVAGAELEAQSKDLYPENQGKKKALLDSLAAEFGSCLKIANSAARDLTAFTASIDRCTLDLRRSASGRIGVAMSSDEAVRQAGGDDMVRPYQHSLLRCLSEEALTEKDVSACVDSFKVHVMREIVNATVRKEVLSNLKEMPDSFLEMERKYSQCVNEAAREKLDESLLACTRDHVLDVTTQIAGRKLVPALKSTLGHREYGEIEPDIKKAEGRFRTCVESLRRETPLSRVTAGAGKCASTLQAEAVGAVQKRMRAWVAEPGDSPEERRLTDLLIAGVPCLDGLMPSEPLSDSAQEAAESSLRSTMTLLAGSLKYDPGKSIDQLPGVLGGLIEDLSKQGPSAARENLVENLVKSGMLDQIIKSIVRSTLLDSFKALKEPLDPRLVSRLTSRDNLDLVFSDPEQMARIRNVVARGVLGPILLQGASMDSPVVQAASNEVKRDVTLQLVNSEHFGSTIIGFTAQQKLDNLSGFTRFFASVLYGEDALRWDVIRGTAQGRKAEAYIRDSLLRPMFFGESIPKDEESAVLAKAEELVTAAVKAAPRKPASSEPGF